MIVGCLEFTLQLAGIHIQKKPLTYVNSLLSLYLKTNRITQPLSLLQLPQQQLRCQQRWYPPLLQLLPQ